MIRFDLGWHGWLRVMALAVVLLFSTGCTENAGNVEKLIADAMQQREKGSFVTAIIGLKNVLQKSPDNAEARYLLGVIYNEIDDFSSAEKELSRALELGYDPVKVIPAWNKSLLSLGNYQKVLDRAHIEGEAANPVLAEILTLRAMASFGLGRNADGRNLLAQALAKQPDFANALLGQAWVAISEKKLDEAVQLVERALASEPKNVDAWLMKGELGQIAGQPEAALAANQKIIEFRPDKVAARLNMASIYSAMGDFDKAREQLNLVRKSSPNRAQLLYVQGLVEYRTGNYAAAREAVQLLLKAAPNHLPGTILAGSIELAAGSHPQAQAYLSRAVELAPNNPYARKLLASSLAKSGQVQRALEVLQPALKQAPDDSELLLLAGEAYLHNSEFVRASDFFQKAAKLDPKSASARTGLGITRLATGETDLAFADLESAVQLDSAKYQADLVLVTLHLRRKNYDQALKALESLERKQPTNPLTYNLKAAIYLGKQDTPNARKQLEHALELQPTYMPAVVNLAKLDLQEKNPKAARGRFETVLNKDKDKDNVQALFALAELAPRIGATQEEQIKWLERARKASPTTLQPLLALVHLYQQNGQGTKALEAAQQARDVAPNDPAVLDTLGALQMRAGQTEQALATYGKFAAQQPNSPAALYRLASAQQLAGRQAEAMKIALQLQKQFGKSSKGFVLEGNVLMAQGKFLEAAKVYEKAYGMEKDSAVVIKMHRAYTEAGKREEAGTRLTQLVSQLADDSGLRLYAAQVYLSDGKYQKAIEQFEWLLGKRPNDVLLLNNLAWAYQQTKDKRALETSESAYKLQPDNVEVADTLGWILVEQGDTRRGIEVLQKAVNAAPMALTIRYHLAQALVKSGDKTRARNELERLLSTDTKFPQQAEAIALIKQLRNEISAAGRASSAP